MTYFGSLMNQNNPFGQLFKFPERVHQPLKGALADVLEWLSTLFLN
jgi:hypothetical protein